MARHGIHIFYQVYTKQGMVAIKGVKEQVLFGQCSEAFYAFRRELEAMAEVVLVPLRNFFLGSRYCCLGYLWGYFGCG